jgi:hypothetical protein
MSPCELSTQITVYNTIHTATHCNALQRTATHCNTQRHTATHCNTLQRTATHCNTLQHTVIHSETLQHTATYCNTLQYTAKHCNALQHTANIMQHTASHCNTLQHTASYCNTLLCTLTTEPNKTSTKTFSKVTKVSSLPNLPYKMTVDWVFWENLQVMPTTKTSTKNAQNLAGLRIWDIWKWLTICLSRNSTCDAHHEDRY